MKKQNKHIYGMFKIDIKPLSVNEAFTGKRHRTKKYNQFKRDLLFLLPNIEVPDGDLFVQFEWGLSSKGSDIDNPLKPFIDVLQE